MKFLYFGNDKIKYIVVNKNKNICVVDWVVGVVVVVRYIGELWFWYIGYLINYKGYFFLFLGIIINS